MQKGSPREVGQIFIFLLVGILILAAVGGTLIYTNYSNNRTKPLSQNPVGISQSTPQPTPSPSPSDISPAPAGAGETANPDSIGANWKTYINIKYGFSFKYPANFDYKINCSTNGLIGFDYIDLINNGAVNCAEISFPVNAYAIYLSVLNESMEKALDIPTSSTSQLSQPEKIILNDRELIKVQRREKDTGEYQNFYFIKHPINTFVLQFFLVHPTRTIESNIINYEETLIKILSTFKFTQ